MTGPIVVATLQFKDVERYRRYQAAFPPIFALSGGRILVADEEPKSISGDGGSISKIVIMQFEDNAAMKALLTNPKYIPPPSRHHYLHGKSRRPRQRRARMRDL